MQTISLPVLEAGEYAGGIWYYEPHSYQSYRYVLGRVGKHPLVVHRHQSQYRPARCAGPHLKKCGAAGRRQRL